LDVTRPGLSPLLGSVVRLTAGTLAHSATAWLREFDSGPHRRFPWAQPEFREWACLSDEAGHHAQTCVQHCKSAFHRREGPEDLLSGSLEGGVVHRAGACSHQLELELEPGCPP